MPEYDLTESRTSLPKWLGEAKCSKVFVEFLEVRGPKKGEPGPVNHASFKVDFTSTVRPSDTGEGYAGVRIDMRPEAEYDSDKSSGGRHYQYGTLIVKAVQYKSKSTKSLCTCELPLPIEIKLHQFTDELLGKKLEEFCFVNEGVEYFGCRDWMLNAIHVLEQKTLIRSSMGEIDALSEDMKIAAERLGVKRGAKVYVALRMLFGKTEIKVWTIKTGSFHPSYKPVTIGADGKPVPSNTHRLMEDLIRVQH